jgi:transposase-like protein
MTGTSLFHSQTDGVAKTDETWAKQALAELMDASQHVVLAGMSFTRQHRTKLHCANPIERILPVHGPRSECPHQRESLSRKDRLIART